MTHVSHLIGPDVLAADLAAGFIRSQEHSTLPYTILNYTEKAQFARHWTAATLQCRGLIVDRDGVVVARPFPKFFNHDQPEGVFPREGPVTVIDKLDGSLGILYPTHDGYAIATRGSFESDQALHATAVFKEKYEDWEPPVGYTVQFEIIYPDNRIVVDYGHRDDLVLLGAVHNESGGMLTPDHADWLGWPGPAAEVFKHERFARALAMRQRPNAEGVVVHFRDTNTMVKIKQADYVALHRIVTGWNERTIWQHLRDGGTIDDLAESLPDEFHQWAKDVASRLRDQGEVLAERVLEEHQNILRQLGCYPDTGKPGRKDYATHAVKSPYRSALFLLLDGVTDRAEQWMWDQIKPSTKEASIA